MTYRVPYGKTRHEREQQRAIKRIEKLARRSAKRDIASENTADPAQDGASRDDRA
jgi:hypothetical protein